ncbi:hypothetical protein LSAT2_019327 [Lamellibrachia satsuma]|nr:hypothetical protein LSAT2_019327 [Lamellibrachia satsuma]
MAKSFVSIYRNNESCSSLLTTTAKLAVVSQALVSQALVSQVVGSQAVVSQAVVSQVVGSQAVVSQAVVSQAIGSQAVVSQAVGYQAVGSQAVVSQVVVTQAVGSQAVVSQAVGSQAVVSQAVGSQVVVSQAVGSQAVGQVIYRDLQFAQRNDANIRTNTLILAPTYGGESGSGPVKRGVPCTPRSDAESSFNIRRTSSCEDCRADGGDGAPRTDQTYPTLPGYPTSPATRKHLYESPLYSHGAHGSPARSAVYYELAATGNRSTDIGRGQMPVVLKANRNMTE